MKGGTNCPLRKNTITKMCKNGEKMQTKSIFNAIRSVGKFGAIPISY